MTYKVEPVLVPRTSGSYDRPYIVRVNNQTLLDKRGNPRRFTDSIAAAVAGAKEVDRLRVTQPAPAESR